MQEGNKTSNIMYSIIDWSKVRKAEAAKLGPEDEDELLK